jgi:hypothetical protein
MQAILLAVLAVAAPMYSLRLGLSEAQWKGMVSNTLGHPESGYVVTQVLHAPGGSTLVRWSSTPGLDPKGPNGLGIQLYGPGGTFKKWLASGVQIDRPVLQCGPYLLGGNSALHVWNAKAEYRLVKEKLISSLKPYARLKCVASGVAVQVPVGQGTWQTRQTLALPSLQLLR